jgi:hypothetical protein
VFEPIGLAVLATQLVIGNLDATVERLGASRECRLRTALGGAYYGLYLATRAVIVRRHGVSSRWISHGMLHTQLWHSRAGRDVQALGHEFGGCMLFGSRPTMRWRPPSSGSRS